MPEFEIRLLGPFQVIEGETAVPSPRRKTRALLAYLAATGRAHTRTTLADLFCQEAQNPGRVLRLLLSRIRRQLHPDLLLIEGETVQFDHAAAWVDHAAFVRVLDGDLASHEPNTVAKTVDLVRGQFLDGMALPDAPEFELWLLGERARLQRLYERGLNHLVSRLGDTGEYEGAVARAQQLLQSNSLLEEAHAHLIWLYARTGRREAALEQYVRCRDLLADELAVEPTPELQRLRDDVVAGRITPSPTLLATPAAPEEEEMPQLGPFVGRDGELAQLQEAWTVGGGTVLVEAEAGGGKTRLVQTFARRTSGVHFLVGRCYESTNALPYHPWIELLDAHLETVDDGALNQLSQMALEYLLRLLPDLAHRLGREAPPAAPTEGGELERLFAAVAESLFVLPGRDAPPALLFLDDLQWADETSLRLFHFIARRLPAGMLVGAFRGEEADAAPALRTLRDDLRRHPDIAARHLHLEALTPDAIDALTAQLWERLPTGYRPHVVSMLAQATGGNPLFLTEVLHELAHTREVPSELPVPPSVRDLVRRRLGRLPQSGQQVVEALSVLNTPAPLPLTWQTSGRSEDETAAAIDLGLRRGLLQADATERPTRYTFSHDLLREAVVGQLSPVRRELLHRRAARALASAGAEAATLAYHWRMAGDATREAHYALQAGRDAAAVYANDEAIRYLRRAVANLPDKTERMEALGELGNVYILVGQWEAAEELFRGGLALAEAAEDLQQQARFHGALGQIYSRQSRYPRALAELEQARAAGDAADDRAGVARYVGTMGIVYWLTDELDQALVCFKQALEIDTELENEKGIAIWQSNMAGIYNQRGEHERALAGFRRSLQARRALDYEEGMAIDLGNVASAYRNLGRYEEAFAHYEEALALRRELGDRPGVAVVVGNLGVTYLLLGVWERAAQCLCWAALENADLGHREGVAVYAGHLADVYRQQGEGATALALLARTVPVLRGLAARYHLGRHLLLRARILLAEGDLRLAERAAAESEAIAAGVDDGETALAAHLLGTQVRVRMGQVDVATAVADMEGLLAEQTEDEGRAAVHYAIWQVEGGEEEAHGARAAALYGPLARETGTALYRQRLRALTGEEVPLPLSLPEVPEGVATRPGSVDDLIEHLDRLLDEVAEGGDS